MLLPNQSCNSKRMYIASEAQSYGIAKYHVNRLNIHQNNATENRNFVKGVDGYHEKHILLILLHFIGRHAT